MKSLLLYLLLFYILYKMLKSLFRQKTYDQQSVKGNPHRKKPPPYNPDNVEDIDYEEVNKK